MRGKLQFAVGLLVSIGCLVLVFRGLQWSEVVHALTQANLTLIALSGLLTVVGLVWRTFRWRVLFYPQRGLGFRMLLDALNVGYLASNILPARVGEVVRPYVLSEIGGPPFTTGLSTVMVERIVDTLSVVILMLGMAPFLALPGWAVSASLITGAILLFFTLGLVLIARREQSWRHWLAKLLGRFRLNPETWGERLAALLRGFAVLSVPAAAWRVALWTLVIWLSVDLSYFLVLRAFGLEVSFAVAVFGLSAIALGVAAPSSPGQVGVYEGAGVLALALFTADHERAVSAVLAMHAVNYVLLCLIGFWSLARRSLSYRDLLGKARQTEKAVP